MKKLRGRSRNKVNLDKLPGLEIYTQKEGKRVQLPVSKKPYHLIQKNFGVDSLQTGSNVVRSPSPDKIGRFMKKHFGERKLQTGKEFLTDMFNAKHILNAGKRTRHALAIGNTDPTTTEMKFKDTPFTDSRWRSLPEVTLREYFTNYAVNVFGGEFVEKWKQEGILTQSEDGKSSQLKEEYLEKCVSYFKSDSSKADPLVVEFLQDIDKKTKQILKPIDDPNILQRYAERGFDTENLTTEDRIVDERIRFLGRDFPPYFRSDNSEIVNKVGRIVTYKVTQDDNSIYVHHLPVKNRQPLQLTGEEQDYLASASIDCDQNKQRMRVHCAGGTGRTGQVVLGLLGLGVEFKSDKQREVLRREINRESNPVQKADGDVMFRRFCKIDRKTVASFDGLVKGVQSNPEQKSFYKALQKQLVALDKEKVKLRGEIEQKEENFETKLENVEIRLNLLTDSDQQRYFDLCRKTELLQTCNNMLELEFVNMLYLPAKQMAEKVQNHQDSTALSECIVKHMAEANALDPRLHRADHKQVSDLAKAFNEAHPNNRIEIEQPQQAQTQKKEKWSRPAVKDKKKKNALRKKWLRGRIGKSYNPVQVSIDKNKVEIASPSINQASVNKALGEFLSSCTLETATKPSGTMAISGVTEDGNNFGVTVSDGKFTVQSSDDDTVRSCVDAVSCDLPLDGTELSMSISEEASDKAQAMVKAVAQELKNNGFDAQVVDDALSDAHITRSSTGIDLQ